MKYIRLFAKRMVLFFIVLISLSHSGSAQVIALPHGYAHNDYWHKRPLFDALENGFTYIEADVYLRHSHLLVAHRPPFLRKHHTIEVMYLDPLFKRLASTSEQSQT